MTIPYRFLIGDDHEHARKAMRMILEMDPAFEVVAEATNGQEVVRLTEEYMPDYILMDINMPILNGLQATGLIKDRFPFVKIIIVTVSDDVTDLFEAIKRGAQGYLVKNLHPEIWLEYIHSLITEEVAMPRDIALRILQELSTKANHYSKKEKDILTQREAEILSLVATGMSNKEIADQLIISDHTVKNHLKNIMHKLHLHNRVQLTRYAFEHGWNNPTNSKMN